MTALNISESRYRLKQKQDTELIKRKTGNLMNGISRHFSKQISTSGYSNLKIIL